MTGRENLESMLSSYLVEETWVEIACEEALHNQLISLEVSALHSRCTQLLGLNSQGCVCEIPPIIIRLMCLCLCPVTFSCVVREFCVWCISRECKCVAFLFPSP